MNSIFKEENLYAFVVGVGQEKASELFSLSRNYIYAVEQGDQDRIRYNYLRLEQHIKNEERRTGISVLESPDENHFVAVTALAAKLVKNIVENLKANEPKKNTKVFSSVEDADLWLSENSDIEVISLKVPTKSSYGIMGSKLIAEKVSLDYMKHNSPTGYRYGMTMFQNTKLFTKADPKEYIEKWASGHPDIEVICYSCGSIITRNKGIHFFESGFDRSERITIFIIYRKKVNFLQP